MKIPFYKLSGSGNDFIIIDNRTNLLQHIDASALAQAVCRRTVSIGADGLILIENPRTSGCDFSWRFYNSDGSEAEMCGNGGRCAARYAFITGIGKAKLSFETRAGIIHAEVAGNQATIELPSPKLFEQNISLAVDARQDLMHFINTGVPHVVVFVDTVETLQIQDIGRKIRFHQQFQPAGTNVNFVSVASDSQLLIRTYERGVEDETMACGTGSVAAALVASALGKVPLPVKVKTQGGEILTVAAEHASYPFGHVYLTGAVRMICVGELWEEAYT